jgi:DNA-binding winged helix-turn-helix (wHTH) protein
LPIAIRIGLISIVANRNPTNMTQEESLVLSFLQERAENAFGRGEIARRAGKRKMVEENPHWVDVPLASLVAKDLVKVNKSGEYQFNKPDILDLR